jgi:hypothetical protein
VLSLRVTEFKMSVTPCLIHVTISNIALSQILCNEVREDPTAEYEIKLKTDPLRFATSEHSEVCKPNSPRKSKDRSVFSYLRSTASQPAEQISKFQSLSRPQPNTAFVPRPQLHRGHNGDLQSHAKSKTSQTSLQERRDHAHRGTKAHSPELPKELQLRIWEQAKPKAKIVEFKVSDRHTLCSASHNLKPLPASKPVKHDRSSSLRDIQSALHAWVGL